MEPCLSVVIPAHHDLTTLGDVLQTVLGHPAVRELIVVDDGIVEGQRSQLPALADARVSVLVVPLGLDRGEALRWGFAAVSAPLVAVLDAEHAVDADDLDRVLAPLLEDRADVVFFGVDGAVDASRSGSGGRLGWPAVGDRLLSVASTVTGHRPRAATTGSLGTTATGDRGDQRLLAVRRDVLKVLVAVDHGATIAPGFDPGFAARATRAGWRVGHVPSGPAPLPVASAPQPRPAVSWRGGAQALLDLARDSRLASLVPTWRRPPALRALAAGPAPTASASGVASRPTMVGGAAFDAPKATDWLVDLIEPWLGRRVVLLGDDAELADRLARRPGADLALILLAREPASRAELQRRFAGRTDLRVAAGPADCFDRRRPVDTVVLAGFLEHEADPAVLLGMLRAALTPGGRLVFLVPALAGLRRELTAATRPTRAVQAFDKPAVRRLLSEAGLRAETLRAVNATITLSPRLTRPRDPAAAGPVTTAVAARSRAGSGLARSSRAVSSAIGPEARRWAARSYDKVAVPLLRAVEDRVELPVGQSLFCVATPAASPGRAQARSGEGKVVVLP